MESSSSEPLERMKVAENRHRRNKKTAIIAISIVVIIILASVAYRNMVISGDDWDDGLLELRSYDYEFTLKIVNVTGPYEIIIPIIVMTTGDVLPEIDFLTLAPSKCELVDTEHGLGLKVTGDGPFEGKLTGAVENLHKSDMEDRGDAYISVVEGGIVGIEDRNVTEVWMYSDQEELDIRITATYDEHREWVNWLGITDHGGYSGWMQEVRCDTELDWSKYPFAHRHNYWGH